MARRVASKKFSQKRRTTAETYLLLFRAMLWFFSTRAGRRCFLLSFCAACFAFLSSDDNSQKVLGVLRQAMYSSTQKVGFTLKDVTVLGRYRSQQSDILNAIDVRAGNPIFEYDVRSMRDKLEQLAWVKTAKVHRNLCGRIHIYITERHPIAVYHDQNKFVLVDQDGELINAPIDACFRGLPVLSGKNACAEAPAVLQHIDKFKSIRSRLVAMAFIQERRWDIKLNNSVEVKLPDHDIEEALKVLSVLIEEGKVLSGDITKVDLRIDGKAIFMLSKSGQEYFSRLIGASKL
jgi:cell division protein FtsQ